ncbi:MAG TPA: hypothetical protein VKU00_03440 [Chthonomonadaceae bacterium]|nr:hypothetical protein [Chthonomonadaceae bacterium]
MENPARYWRDIMIREIYLSLKIMHEDMDAFLLAHSISNYQESISWMEQGRTKNHIESNLTKSYSYSIFISAIAMFTFGHLEVVEDILKYLPSDELPVRIYKSTLRALMPLPEELKSSRNWKGIIAWILQNRDDLIWSEETGRYVKRASG